VEGGVKKWLSIFQNLQELTAINYNKLMKAIFRGEKPMKYLSGNSQQSFLSSRSSISMGLQIKYKTNKKEQTRCLFSKFLTNGLPQVRVYYSPGNNQGVTLCQTQRVRLLTERCRSMGLHCSLTVTMSHSGSFDTSNREYTHTHLKIDKFGRELF